MKINSHLIKKYFPKALMICSAIILVIISILVGLSYLINPNNYKGYLEQKFANYYGGQLILSGPLKLRFFPHLRFQAQDITIKNPPNFKNADFAKINSLDINISLSRLIYGTIKIDKLRLNGVKLNLIKQGERNNWTLKTQNQQSRTGKTILNNLALENLQLSYFESGTMRQTKPFNLFINQHGGSIIVDAEQIKLNHATIAINNDFNSQVNGKIYTSPQLSYTGNLNIDDFSLNKLASIFNVKLPAKLKKTALAHIALTAEIKGDDNNTNIDKLNLLLNKTTIKGNIAIEYKPFTLSESLIAGPTQINEFVDLDGYGLKFNSLTLNGKLTANSKLNPVSINGKEKLDIKNIILSGFDIKRFTRVLDKAIGNISGIKKITTTSQVHASITVLKAEIDKLQGKRAKSAADTSDLGELQTTMLIQKGIMTTPECILDGRDIGGDGNGYIYLAEQSIDYIIEGIIKAPSNNSFINELYIPYRLKGKFSDISGSFEWGFMLKELVYYYNQHEKEKPALSRALGALGHMFVESR